MTAPEAMPVEIRVVVADDQELVCQGLATLLESDPGITAVGLAHDGVEAVELSRLHRPDVVVMDIRMPRMDGITATRRIRATPGLDGTRVLVLTTFDDDDNLFAALQAGCSGFITKDTEPDDLRAAVHTIASGHSLLAPEITTRVIRHAVTDTRSDPESTRRIGTLTEREREVLTLVAKGMTNLEVSRELVVSPATARTYVSRLMTKLDARDRVALVILAYRGRLV